MAPGQDLNKSGLQQRILQNTLQEVAARTEDATADCCVICLDAITEPCEAFPCSHRNFDYICLSSWLFETPHCPLCKASVLKIVHGPPDASVTTYFDGKKPAVASSSSATASTSTQSFYRGDYGLRARFNCPRRRPRRCREQSSRPAVSDAIVTRRDVYRYQRYSKHVGSNRLSHYRELTPHMFCTDSELVSRARMWVRRELRVFSFLSLDGEDYNGGGLESRNSSEPRNEVQRRRANNSEFLLEYIIAILKSVDIIGSGGQAESMLSEFLGRDNTKLFLHELRAWLRSPYTKLEDWDRSVQYGDVLKGRYLGEEASRGCSDEMTSRNDGQGRLFRVRQVGDYYRPRAVPVERRTGNRLRGATSSRRQSASPE